MWCKPDVQTQLADMPVGVLINERLLHSPTGPLWTNLIVCSGSQRNRFTTPASLPVSDSNLGQGSQNKKSGFQVNEIWRLNMLFIFGCRFWSTLSRLENGSASPDG